MTAVPPSAAVPDPADVEKVARAMHAVDDVVGSPVLPWDDEDTDRAAYRRLAAAALAAVRPSPDSEAVARVLALDVWADPFGQWTTEQADAARKQQAEMERRIRAALGTGDREGGR